MHGEHGEAAWGAMGEGLAVSGEGEAGAAVYGVFMGGHGAAQRVSMGLYRRICGGKVGECIGMGMGDVHEAARTSVCTGVRGGSWGCTGGCTGEAVHGHSCAEEGMHMCVRVIELGESARECACEYVWMPILPLNSRSHALAGSAETESSYQGCTRVAM